MPLPEGGSEIEGIFIEEISRDGETLWNRVDKALTEKKEVLVYSALLDSLNNRLGEMSSDRKWLKIEVTAFKSPDWLFRLRDVSLSFLALFILSPLLIAIALLIKISSPGPVFYKAFVVGKGGKQFLWRKFRSMKVIPEIEDTEQRRKQFQAFVENQTASETKDAPAKIIDSHRVTSIGRIIRKFSADELPQLWNVLLGQMSLVGPRPCLPYEEVFFTGWRERRFNIRPGLTGVWQVFGRGKAAFDESAALDVYYTYRRSFGFDVYLILKTIGVVFTAKGAR